MSTDIDYVHLQNLIMGGVQKITDKAAQRGEDETIESYSELIQFLEHQYVSTVLALVGAILVTAKMSSDPEQVRVALMAAREILDTPAKAVEVSLKESYEQMIKDMNLPDAYEQKTHNEKVADEILTESKQPDSQ